MERVILYPFILVKKEKAISTIKGLRKIVAILAVLVAIIWGMEQYYLYNLSTYTKTYSFSFQLFLPSIACIIDIIVAYYFLFSKLDVQAINDKLKNYGDTVYLKDINSDIYLVVALIIFNGLLTLYLARLIIEPYIY